MGSVLTGEKQGSGSHRRRALTSFTCYLQVDKGLKWKWKPQRDETSHPLGQLLLKNKSMVTSIDEEVEVKELEPSRRLMGMQNGAAAMETRMVGPQRIKHRLPHNSISGYISKRNESRDSNRLFT